MPGGTGSVRGELPVDLLELVVDALARDAEGLGHLRDALGAERVLGADVEGVPVEAAVGGGASSSSLPQSRRLVDERSAIAMASIRMTDPFPLVVRQYSGRDQDPVASSIVIAISVSGSSPIIPLSRGRACSHWKSSHRIM